MKLMFGTIRPGKILEVVEGGKGKIKVSAPGLFTNEDEINNLPPVYPWPFGQHANSYSCPKVGEEIWIMNFQDNPLQLHWVRKDFFEKNNESLPLDIESQNLEVVVNREFENSKWAMLYFDNGDGWMMRKGEEGLINIREDGSILLKTQYNKRIIDICKDSISLGTEGKAEDSALLYDRWKEWVEKDLRDTVLKGLAGALKSNPYTISVGSALDGLLSGFPNSSKIDAVKSQNVSITSN